MSARTETAQDHEQNLFYRSSIIWFGELACEVMSRHDVDKNPVLLEFPNYGCFDFRTGRTVTNAAFESSCIAIRAVLHFLGLGLDSEKGTVMDRKNPRCSDVLIEHLVGGVKATEADLADIIQAEVPHLTLESFALALIAADKTVAHMTRDTFSQLNVLDYAATCRVTNILLRRSLANAGLQFPDLIDPRKAATDCRLSRMRWEQAQAAHQ
jgi:hypothetical protein